MTDRNEIVHLQSKARACGRTCNLFFDTEDRIEAVFYRDPLSKGFSDGKVINPLSFVEIERAKPWNCPERLDGINYD